MAPTPQVCPYVLGSGSCEPMLVVIGYDDIGYEVMGTVAGTKLCENGAENAIVW